LHHVRGPAALYQFCLFPSGAFSLPFVSPDFAARYGFEQGEPEETAKRFFAGIHPDDLPRNHGAESGRGGAPRERDEHGARDDDAGRCRESEHPACGGREDGKRELESGKDASGKGQGRRQAPEVK
jgi:hypothetical protein